MGLPSLDFSYWLFQTLAMMATCFLIPKLKVTGPIAALATVLAIAFVNAHLWNTALFLSIPDSFTLQTAVLLIVNGLIFWVVVKVLPGIEVQGLLPAIAAPVVFTICSLVIQEYGSHVDWVKVCRRGAAVFEQAQRYLQAPTNISATAPPR